MRQSDLFMDSSILYRSTQKYFDKKLQDYHLTYAQLPVLIMVYEKEGISLQEIALQGVYDKGTITKNVQKLESLGFIEVLPSKKDKRSKELYTTTQAKSMMVDIYNLRMGWWKHLNSNIPSELIDRFSDLFLSITENAKSLADQNDTLIQFYDHQKVNLKEYPDHISTVLYTGGCNFQCSNCPRKDLVFLKQNQVELPLSDIENYLEKRKGMIQAVCIKGGEPCMHPELGSFLVYVKSLGYKVLIETNGSYPENLQEWILEGYVDYVRLLIKNAPDAYEECIGIHPYDVSKINKTIQILKESNIEYSYVTTVYSKFHSQEKLVSISKWLSDNTLYEIKSGDVDIQQLEDWISKMKVYMPNVRIGGIS